MKNYMVICSFAVTEVRTKEEIDQFVEEVGAYHANINKCRLIFEISKEGRIGYSLPGNGCT